MGLAAESFFLLLFKSFGWMMPGRISTSKDAMKKTCRLFQP